ncbi:hypothetical protein [Oceanirhabdus seepicola]|uniref:Uncharacterized protein n=1 Tax=Oceanirhabdus seepicola TaxID=2828781 RepID=A0A9J6P9X8_9CLOT|nr:hypothetical protein [Oceanirhabdus seepicola]MCM1992221.1 hypothetical protein [Oceanirhabdus seepicola]
MSNEDKFIKKAKKAFRYRNISILIVFIGFFGMLPLGIMLNKIFNFQNIGLLVVGGFILSLIISTVISSIHWKCPSCNRRFSTRNNSMYNMTHCPYCGVKLRNRK